MSHSEMYRTLFACKAWADTELFSLLRKDVLAGHTQKLQATLRILNHVYVIDKIFQSNLQGLPHGYTELNTPETPLLEDLYADVQNLDQWYLHYISGLSGSQIDQKIGFRFVDGRQGCMTRGEMLLHVASHGTNHRGAVGYILSSHGIEPSRSNLTVFLHL